MPEPDGQRTLRVEVHEQHAAAVLGERGAQVDRGGRLADAALLVAHRDDRAGPWSASVAGSGGSGRPVGPEVRLRAAGPVRGRDRAGRDGEVGPLGSPWVPCLQLVAPGRSGCGRVACRIRVGRNYGERQRFPRRPAARHVAWRPEPTPVTAPAGRVDLAVGWLRSVSCRPGGGQSRRPRAAGRRDQRVELRRRHRRVAEQFLHRPNVGTAVQQVGRERVPQRVRRDVLSDAGPRRGLPQHRPGALPRQPGPPGIEDSARRSRRPPAVACAGRPRTRYASTAATANEPTGTTRCLPPFPDSSTRPPRGRGRPVPGRPPRRSGAGAVQHLQQRTVAQRGRGAGGRGGRDEGLDLLDRDRLRQPARRPGRVDRPGRVVAGRPLPRGEAVQPAHRHDGAAGGRRRQRRWSRRRARNAAANAPTSSGRTWASASIPAARSQSR